MRTTLKVFGAALVAAAPLAAQQQQAGAAAAPAGWTTKMDPKDATKSTKFVTMGPGFHVTAEGAGPHMWGMLRSSR